MNIRNVLVPVDFSAPSILAVDYAVSLARKFRASVTLMHVVESPSTLTHPFRAENARVEAARREQTFRMLSALLAPEDQDDLDLRIVIKSGDIKGEIIATIREQEADVVVMGTHGRGLFARLIIGSITEAILRRVSIPVLTVSRAIRPLAFTRLLFATDLSDSSIQGFKFALEMARKLGSDMVLLHAVDNSGRTYTGDPMAGYVAEHAVEHAERKLAELVAEAGAREVEVEPMVVEGAAAEQILKISTESDADLLLIAVGHKGFVERALLGTTAERVIREAHVPVLSIPAPFLPHASNSASHGPA